MNIPSTLRGPPIIENKLRIVKAKDKLSVWPVPINVEKHTAYSIHGKK